MKRGTHHTEEQRKKLSLAHMGKKLSEETKRKIGDANRGEKNFFWGKSGKLSPNFGKHHSIETRKKIGDAVRGEKSFMWGKHQTPESNHKRSQSLKGRKFSKPSCRKGIKLSEKTKKKMSESHRGKKGYWLGLKFSEEHRRKISELHRGSRNPMYGKHPSLETRKKIIISRIGKHHSIETIEKIRKSRMNRIFPTKDTSIEIKLQDALKERGIAFTTHKPIIGQPDIFIEPNICVFADGCYWHSCEQCYDKNKFNGMQRAKIIRDNFVTQSLINKKYKVLRFWEHEINKNIDECITRIFNTIDMKVHV